MSTTRAPAALPAPRPDLVALEGYHSPQVAARVRLNTNESPFEPPAGFVDAWLEALRTTELRRYPDRGAGALRAAIGSAYGQPAARVFAANGSNEVLQTLLLAYGGSTRSALVFEPTYALHSHITLLTGTKLVVGERDVRMRVTPESVAELVAEHRPAVVFLCSPNNPTGTVDPRETVEAVLETVATVGSGLLVVDEAYGEFAPWSSLDLVGDDVPLVVVRTFSKVWSLAALRLGFCVAAPAVVEQLDKVVLPYHLDTATQLAGVEAMRHEAAMRDRVATIVAERERLEAELGTRTGVTALPSGANFVLVRVDPGAEDPVLASRRARELWQQLLAAGVLVRDFSGWPRLEGSLRITVGTPEENGAFLDALDACLEEVAL